MADKLPVLQRQEQSNPTLLSGGFSEAMNKLAQSDTLIGELSTKVMQSAAQDRALQKGYEMGETPQGDLTPSVTDFDKTLESAYKSRSQAVLGNQAQSLLNKGQEVLAQSKLTQDGIDSYKSNSVMGMDEILANAPAGVKQNLQAQYDSTLNNSIHQLNLKLNTQIKSDNEQNYSVYAESALHGVYSAAMLGNDEAIKKSMDDFTTFNQQSLDANTITKKTFKSNQDAMRLSKDTGISIRKAIQARNNHKLNDYLATFSDAKNKPKDMPINEWESVAKNTFSYMNNLTQYKNAQDQQTTLELEIKANAGKLDGPELIAKTSTMDDINGRKALLSVQKIDAKRLESENTTSKILANSSDGDFLSDYTPKQLTAAHHKQTQNFMDAAKKEGLEITPDEAEMKAALSINSTINSYGTKLSNGILKGGPSAANRLSIAIKVFKAKGKADLLNISKPALAKLANYEMLVDNGAVSPAEAFQKATELSEMDKVVLETRNIAWANEEKTNFPDTKKQIEKGRSLLGLSNFPFGWFNTPVANQDVMVRTALKLYKENFILTGTPEAAQKATEDAMQIQFAPTEINGKAEVARTPLMVRMNLPGGGRQAIWDDAKEHISHSLIKMKQQYDDKKIDYYYEFTTPSDERYPITKRIDEISPEFQPPQISKKYRGGGEQKFQLRMDARQGESTSTGTNYNLTLENDLAKGILFDLLPDSVNGNFIYIPNEENINKNYETNERERRKDPEKTNERITSHNHFTFKSGDKVNVRGRSRFNINTGKK